MGLLQTRDHEQAAVVLRAMVGLGTGDGLKYHVRLFLTTRHADSDRCPPGRDADLGVCRQEGCSRSRPVARRFGRSIWAGSRLASSAIYLVILVLCLTFVAQKSYNPFIYFRF